MLSGEGGEEKVIVFLLLPGTANRMLDGIGKRFVLIFERCQKSFSIKVEMTLFAMELEM